MYKKNIVIGVTGGIAAFKTCQLVSDLVKRGFDVQVLMTENAKQFIAPLTFETLTKHRIMDTFDRNFVYEVEHISIAKKADAFMIVPATANVIAKVVNGIADDMLTTTFLAATCPKLIAPAMNTNMYENPVTQRNLQIARELGYKIVEPISGNLACGDVGNGKLADEDVLMAALEEALWDDRCLEGKKLVVTAGPTQEAIDPVRYITNHSSGKMGFAIAKMAKLCGAEVTLIAGKNNLKAPSGVTYIPVVSAEDMKNAVVANSDADIIVKSAAVADYRPATVADEKMKKSDDDLSIPLARTTDILKLLGDNKKEGQVLCGFAMETENLKENARNKLVKKNLDMIVLNDLREQGAGFGVDSNRVTIITADKEIEMPLMSKEDLAYELCKIYAKVLKGEEVCY